jgi:hypothetical protein
MLRSCVSATPRVPEGAEGASDGFAPRYGPVAGSSRCRLVPPSGQDCQRSDKPLGTRTPAPDPVWRVKAGSSATTRFPAARAGKARMVRNIDHPASAMDLARGDCAPQGRPTPPRDRSPRPGAAMPTPSMAVRHEGERGDGVVAIPAREARKACFLARWTRRKKA